MATVVEEAFIGPDDRLWLVLYCTRLVGGADIAEDLAQETLLEAWRNRHKIYDLAGLRPWLAAIARNMHHRWARKAGAEISAVVLDEDIDLAADDDVTVELDRADLATLLDRALAALPPSTRMALIAHYIDEMPQSAIAGQLGMTESAVAVRLHRGKLVLRKLLATDLREDAESFGLRLPSDSGWEETRLWCFICGEQRLLGKFDVVKGHLTLRCARCSQGMKTSLIDHCGVIQGIKTYGAALNRVESWIAGYFLPVIEQGEGICIACGRRASMRLGRTSDERPAEMDCQGIWLDCACGVYNTCALVGLALGSPEGYAFRRANQRIRLLSSFNESVDGGPFVVRYQSLTNLATFTATFAPESLQLVETHLTP